jgi:hypothetical protein
MLTDNEKAKLIEFVAQVNELYLSEKDERILRHLLQLIAAWEIKAALLKKKEQKEKSEKWKLRIEKGMSFSNAEKQIREYAR